MTASIQIDLGLPGIEVIQVKNDVDGNYHITIGSTLDAGKCHVCGEKISKFHGFDREICIRHLPILGKECYLYIKLPRFQCIDCHKHPTTTQQLSWKIYKSGYTKAFEQYILQALMGSTLSDVSFKEGISEGCISRIVERYVEPEIDWSTIDEIGQLGIDEISLRKGHKDFVTIISSRCNGRMRVLAVLNDRKKETIMDFFKSIPKQQRRSIKSVCSDLYDGFINAAKEVLGKRVIIVIDRFHVAKLYRKGVDTLRKQEMNELSKALDKKTYKELKGVMWALRKSKISLSKTEKELLEKLFNYSPKLKEAYALRNQLTAIFNTNTTRNGGIRRLKNWIKTVENSEVSCFKTFIGTLGKRINEIANYFINRENSGFVEGLNNRIKVIKRRCYGMADRVQLFKRISLELDGACSFV